MVVIEDRHIRRVLLVVWLLAIAALVALWLLGRKLAPAGLPTPSAIERLCRVEGVPLHHWRYIVLHHSATPSGSAEVFDRYHREKRGWKHGLGYHFVIGNGHGAGDGEIQVGDRWRKQEPGAHANDLVYNRDGIGICLVGNFETEPGPTPAQMESLRRLLRYLMRKFNIPPDHIVRHCDIQPGHTVCPGKHFPFDQLIAELKQSAKAKKTTRRQP